MFHWPLLPRSCSTRGSCCSKALCSRAAEECYLDSVVNVHDWLKISGLCYMHSHMVFGGKKTTTTCLDWVAGRMWLEMKILLPLLFCFFLEPSPIHYLLFFRAYRPWLLDWWIDLCLGISPPAVSCRVSSSNRNDATHPFMGFAFQTWVEDKRLELLNSGRYPSPFSSPLRASFPLYLWSSRA